MNRGVIATAGVVVVFALIAYRTGRFTLIGQAITGTAKLA